MLVTGKNQEEHIAALDPTDDDPELSPAEIDFLKYLVDAAIARWRQSQTTAVPTAQRIHDAPTRPR